MKAVVWHDRGKISLDNVADPGIRDRGDAIVRLTMSAICGTDLHMIRGTFPGMVDGTILGHEGVGVVEEVGDDVRNFRPGDRVVVPSTLCCGACTYCRAGYSAQCDRANPHGHLGGTAIFGGPEPAGPFDGMQAGYVRVPWAGANLVPIPDQVIDEQAIICSDVLPTGWFGAKLAEVTRGDTVAVFGCGPVGQLAITSAFKLGAGRVLAVDQVPDRLETARRQHADPIDFSREDPVETMRELTNGVGPDRVIDAVGVDAYPGPESETSESEQRAAAGGEAPTWHYGTLPSQAARWAVSGVAKAGTIGVIGVYPAGFDAWPIGSAMNRNLTVHLGNCNHRPLIPELLDMVASGVIDPSNVVTRQEPVTDAIEAYRVFDEQQPGWVKVALEGMT
ncbi:threonine dehydrogenase-like Zn-dependent dehydrogenase [Saccharopolyspora lacisalsi]|uniref:Threonine dehydrogenase-like Zn-dependent dehydrogenase n=1 Tax=Halosaccharopolyspora lacisalsi TaxID=1000566 RepID=A0A839E3P2_9PSEU|nr:alcohol dehydrogenase catalytic domain-containing protein [Halosaccharopolyspora lacisalsi]MBA8826347.1 threonine dehydrogenase-like Zn-dependent dehydrogenase [Halosaccharopolyspora lacisalsi]